MADLDLQGMAHYVARGVATLVPGSMLPFPPTGVTPLSPHLEHIHVEVPDVVPSCELTTPTLDSVIEMLASSIQRRVSAPRYGRLSLPDVLPRPVRIDTGDISLMAVELYDINRPGSDVCFSVLYGD